MEYHVPIVSILAQLAQFWRNDGAIGAIMVQFKVHNKHRLLFNSGWYSKKRITLRGAQTMFYRVREKKDGTIELSPRVLVHPDEISAKTLSTIDQSVDNLKKGKASKAVDC